MRGGVSYLVPVGSHRGLSALMQAQVTLPAPYIFIYINIYIYISIHITYSKTPLNRPTNGPTLSDPFREVGGLWS